MNVDGVKLKMELDTGAAVSVVSLHDFRKLFPRKQLRPTMLTPRTYTGDLVKPKGLALVIVQHKDQSKELPLYVVETKGPALLGREWLQEIRLDWKNLVSVNRIDIREVGRSWMPW